jgi:hypothetical protein
MRLLLATFPAGEAQWRAADFHYVDLAIENPMVLANFGLASSPSSPFITRDQGPTHGLAPNPLDSWWAMVSESSEHVSAY